MLVSPGVDHNYDTKFIKYTTVIVNGVYTEYAGHGNKI